MKKTERISIFFLTMGLLFFFGTTFQILSGFFNKEEKIIKHHKENFDPCLFRIDNLNKLEYFIDSISRLKISKSQNQLRYAEVADSIISLRFYYGMQNYKFSENFLANLSGKYLWSHFGAKVDPNHILKGSKAFCSQSSIVFQELLKKKGFDVRSVEFPNHFCTEVLIDGEWAFHDVSYKPNFKGNRASMEELVVNIDFLEQAYLYSFKDDFFETSRHYFEEGNFSYGRVNGFPASRMIWFHRITCFFSWFGWLVFGIVYFLVRKKP